ncbi:MAG: hypothetical protein RL385_3418 [Pseudomonadota bacterium]
MKLRTLGLLAALSGCGSQGGFGSTIIMPAEFGDTQPFTESELREPVVARNLRSTPEASFQVLHLNDKLGARSHEKSDAVVMIVSGQVQVVLGKDDFRLSTGNVIEVPRGVAYELVNRNATGSTIYIVHTPSLSADDVKLYREAPRDSAWKWNLWTQ